MLKSFYKKNGLKKKSVSTKNYIALNKYIFSLEKISINVKFKRKAIGRSVNKLLMYHFKSLVRAMIDYPVELYKIGFSLKKTLLINKKFENYRALIIGNGPSQGYLKKNELDFFKSSGGSTICVNYWNVNKNLSAHIPTWIVLSDPNSFNFGVKSVALVKYLRNNSSINLLAPISFRDDFIKFKIKNEIFYFSDTELSVWKNINPILPRGYISMSLYKALAWAVHLGFYQIGVIGMDNTYPREIFVDKFNKLYDLQTHAGEKDYIQDRSKIFDVASYLEECALLFYHLDYFPKQNIVNLDPYSLTDRFRKVDKNDFFKNSIK